MAHAFAQRLGKDVEVHSAGSRPSGQVNPRAIEFMKEIGYDLSTHQSKSLTDIPQEPFEAAVTMGCGDACPHVAAQRRLDWSIPDPKHLPPDEFRKVRDQIETQVRQLLAELDAV